MPCGGPQFGPPPFGSSPFGPPPAFGPPPSFGPPSYAPWGQQVCFPSPGPPPPGPGPMMCFPNQPPPPYAPAPWGQNPWSLPMPVGGPQVPTKANERPPPGARVNGNIANFGNQQQGHIFAKNNTTFHLTLDGAKPWNWGQGGNHRFQVYTAASSMPIDGKTCSFFFPRSLLTRGPQNSSSRSVPFRRHHREHPVNRLGSRKPSRRATGHGGRVSYFVLGIRVSLARLRMGRWSSSLWSCAVGPAREGRLDGESL